MSRFEASETVITFLALLRIVNSPFGRVLQAQGKQADASAYFARALVLMPQLLKQ